MREGNNIDNFLITRFNLRYKEWRQSGYIVGADSSEWMAQRWDLFTRYCLPSVSMQTIKPTEWLLFFDAQTNQLYRDRLRDLSAQFPWITSHFVEDSREFLEYLKYYIPKKTNTHFVATTRLDNDDILNGNSVKCINQEIERYGAGLYVLPRGLCYRMSSKPVLTEYYYPDSPFLTLVEEVNGRKGIQTVFFAGHDRFPNNISKREVRGRYQWIQLIHSSNLSNSMRGRPIFSLRKLQGLEEVFLEDPDLLAYLWAMIIWLQSPIRTKAGIIKRFIQK